MTWDQLLVNRMRARGGRNPLRASLAALVAALVVGLLPGVAHAHFARQGLGGAQLDLGPNDDQATPPILSEKAVTGKNFNPNDVARIFECPYGATDPVTQCQLLGATQTDATGGFTTTVRVSALFVAPSGPVNCQGFNGTAMCSVAAATFSAAQQPTSMAQHYICFQGATTCAWPDEGPTTTTTTTLPPLGPEWAPAPPMGIPREFLAATAGLDGRIYALGGSDGGGNALSAAEVFDPCTRRWSPLPPMPTARRDLAAATGPDGRIYAIGGRDGPPGGNSIPDGTLLAAVDAFDPVAGTWSPVASLAMPRANLAATTGPDGRIYAIGGKGAGTTVGGDPVATVEAFDVVTGAWAPVTPLTFARANHGAATGPDGRIYVAGGEGRIAGWPFPNMESYAPGPGGTPGQWHNPSTDVHVAPQSPPLIIGSYVAKQPSDLAMTTGPDGLIYALGGSRIASMPGEETSLRTVSTYDTSTAAWTASLEPLVSRRAGAGAAPGRDGRLYAIGGVDDQSGLNGNVPLASTEALQVGPNNCPPGPPPPADFDGDGRSDVSVFRPANGTWYVKDGTSSPWGGDGDIPVPGDYDGDRKIDQAIFRPATGLWAIHGSAGVDTFVTYGIGTDIPIPADYDGDGRADLAIYRPEFGTWWMRWSSTGADVPVTFGIAGDVPVPGDYDGDGRAELGIFRDGTWFTLPSSGGGAYTAVGYGAPGDVPVPADYDGDRAADRAVFRPSTAEWFLHHSGDGSDEAFTFGAPGDVPQPGDYNGDGVYDPAVFRGGAWFIETGETYQWGIGTDIALPLPYAIRRTLQ